MPPGPVRVLVATKPVDFRKGMDGLAALVKEQLRADPFSGVIFCFRARRADRVKLVFWDGTGLCLFAKRLEKVGVCKFLNAKLVGDVTFAQKTDGTSISSTVTTTIPQPFIAARNKKRGHID